MPATVESERLLRGADLRVTRPRLAVLTRSTATRTPTRARSRRSVREDLGDVSPPGRLRRARGADRRGPGAAHPAGGLGRALRVAGRRQPSPRRLPLVRRDRRRRLRRRRDPCLTASDDHGYAIDEAEVVYWGLCPACSTRPPRSTPRPERTTMSDSPDAVVGEMNEENGRRLPGRPRARPVPDRGRRRTAAGGRTAST